MSSVSATKFFISSTWVSIVPLSKVSSVSIEILAYNPARNGLLTSVWTVALLTTSGMFFLLYSDMKEGIVSKEDYVELHAAYGKRLRNAEESIRAIQKEMDNELEKADKANTWLDYFVKYQDIEVLTRTVIVELIREIRVHDKKNIEIVFDFDDCYQALLTQLPAMGVEVATDPDNNLQVKIKEVV